MIVRLLLLLTLVPLVELALLLWLASVTHWLSTLALVVGTGVLGAVLVRHQGLRVWQRFQQQLMAGQWPGEALWDGVMILLAGALLITPGLITDLVGFSLLVPACRRLYRRWLLRRFAPRFSASVRESFRWSRGGPGEPFVDVFVVGDEEREG